MKKKFFERYFLFGQLLFWKLIKHISKISLFRHIFRKIYHWLFPYVSTIQVHITSACNYNCIYCYAVKNMCESFSTEDWIRITQEAKDLGISSIDFLGGEPFLHQDFYRLLKTVSRNGMSITIVTNGTLIDDCWIERLKKIDTDLTLCIKYDYNHDIYKKHTGSSQFERIKKIIVKCVDNNIMVITFIVASKYNINYIKEIINDSIDMGAFPVFERYIPVKDEKTNKELELSKEELMNLSELVRDAYSNLVDIIEGKAALRSSICTCFGNNSVAIMQDGYVLPCAGAPLSLRLGNLKEESLSRIFKRLKDKRKIWNRLPVACMQCDSRSICGGGCPIYSFLKKGSCSEKDPLCNGNIPTTYSLCGISTINFLKSVDTQNRIKFLRKSNE